MKEKLIIAGPFLCLVLLFSPVLFSQNNILSFNENVSYDYPLFVAQSELVHADKPIGWNPDYKGGYPFRATPVGNFSDVFTVSLMRIFQDPFLSYHVRMLLSIGLGFLFAYLFGRSLGLSRLSSSLIGIVYFTGYTFDNLTANVSVTSGAFMSAPVLFWAVSKFNTSHKPWSLIIGALFVSLSLIWGLPQIVLYGMVMAGLYAICLDTVSARNLSLGILGGKRAEHGATSIAIENSEPGRRVARGLVRRWKNTLAIGALCIVATLLAVPHFWPTLQLQPLTERVAGFGKNDDQFIVLIDAWHLFFPTYTRLPAFLGPSGFNYNLYIGSLTLLLFVIGVTSLKKTWMRYCLWMMIGVFLILLKPLPFHNWIQELPGFSAFHNLRRLLLPLFLIIGTGVAFTLDHIEQLKTEQKEKARKIIRVITIVLLVLGAGILVINGVIFAFTHIQPETLKNGMDRLFDLIGSRLHPLTRSYYENLLLNNPTDLLRSLLLTNWKFTLPLVSWAGSLWLVSRYLKDRMTTKTFKVSAYGLILGTFLIVHWMLPNANTTSRSAYLAQTPVERYITAERAAGNDYRLFDFLTSAQLYQERIGSAQSITAADSVSLMRLSSEVNTNILHHIPRIDGYEPFQSARQHKLALRLVPESSGTVEQKTEELYANLTLLSALNIKWILSKTPLRDARLHDVTPEDMQNGIRLYENADAKPFVYVPSNVKLVSTWDDVYFVENPVVVECDGCTMSHDTSTLISYQRVSNELIRINATSTSGGWIVIAQSNLPGWTATIDGVSTPIRTAKYLMQAIYIPQGIHSGTLQYTVPSLTLDAVWKRTRH